MQLRDIGDGIAGQGCVDDAALRDAPEHGAFGNACRGKSILDCSDGPQLASPRDGDFLPLPFLVDLAAPIVMRNPSGASAKSSTRSATSSERRNAPAKPSASNARSRLPFNVSGQPSSMDRTTSAVAGDFCTLVVPIVRRIPRIRAFTASAPVGGSCPAALCT
jgi:hypothetical protein